MQCNPRFYFLPWLLIWTKYNTSLGYLTRPLKTKHKPKAALCLGFPINSYARMLWVRSVHAPGLDSSGSFQCYFQSTVVFSSCLPPPIPPSIAPPLSLLLFPSLSSSMLLISLSLVSSHIPPSHICLPLFCISSPFYHFAISYFCISTTAMLFSPLCNQCFQKRSALAVPTVSSISILLECKGCRCPCDVEEIAFPMCLVSSNP